MTHADAYPLVPYQGTYIYDFPERYGIKVHKPQSKEDHWDWDSYFQVGSTGVGELHFEHPNLTHDQIKELFKRFHDEIQPGGMTY